MCMVPRREGLKKEFSCMGAFVIYLAQKFEFLPSSFIGRSPLYLSDLHSIWIMDHLKQTKILKEEGFPPNSELAIG